MGNLTSDENNDQQKEANLYASPQPASQNHKKTQSMTDFQQLQSNRSPNISSQRNNQTQQLLYSTPQKKFEYYNQQGQQKYIQSPYRQIRISQFPYQNYPDYKKSPQIAQKQLQMSHSKQFYQEQQNSLQYSRQMVLSQQIPQKNTNERLSLQQSIVKEQPKEITYLKLCTQKKIHYLLRKQMNPSLNLSLIQKRSLLRHPHLCKFFGINHPLVNAIFNNQSTNGIYFEYFPSTLDTLITTRSHTSLFLESDLIALLKSLISALSYLQSNQIFHGNLSPETVYFDENQGTFKLSDEEIINGEFYSLQMARERKKITLIPPEFIQAARDSSVQEIRENLFKADIWAVGLILLEAATLKKSTDVYDVQNYSIIQQAIYERICWISQFYSPELTHAIRLILEFDPKLRPDFIFMNKLLNQKIPLIKRKAILPSIPIGLNNLRKSTRTENQNNNNNNTSFNEFSPKSPQMLTAMPKYAIENFKAKNKSSNYKEMSQKPIQIENLQQSNEKKSINSGIVQYYPQRNVYCNTKMRFNKEKSIAADMECSESEQKIQNSNGKNEKIPTPLSRNSSKKQFYNSVNDNPNNTNTNTNNNKEEEYNIERKSEKKKNFSETFQKIMDELCETKEIINNYQKKAKNREYAFEQSQKV